MVALLSHQAAQALVRNNVKQTRICLIIGKVITSNNYVTQCNQAEEDRKLVLAFVVNRHGERTPAADELCLSKEQEKLKNLMCLDGLEALTNAGKRRAYQIGKYIRQRYGGLKLISNLYLQDEIAIRSTDKERTKMTALVAMSAVYPPEVEQQWDEGVGKVWQPVPYTAVPLAQDYLCFFSNCNRYKVLLTKAKEASIGIEFKPYRDLMVKLRQETGHNFTANPVLFETLFDLFKSQESLGLDIPEWAKSILPRLTEAATLSYGIHFKNDEMKKISGGVILHQFIEAATAIETNKSVNKRLRIFSAHDFNVGSLMFVSKVVKDINIPEYGAVFSLELYRSRKTGVLSVEPIYLNQAGVSSPQTLRIAGCGSTCDLSTFKELTKEFVLPEHDYYKICR